MRLGVCLAWIGLGRVKTVGIEMPSREREREMMVPVTCPTHPSVSVTVSCIPSRCSCQHCPSATTQHKLVTPSVRPEIEFIEIEPVMGVIVPSLCVLVCLVL